MGVLTGAGVRILLVGTGQHTAGSELPDLPTVSATVTDLAATVVERCGAQPDQVRTLLDPASPLVLGRELTTAAAEAEDVLVVCYLGHGLLDARGELYLATQATDHLRDGLGYTALPYATLHAELANSRARSVIVLLDCCFSGWAAGSPYPADLDGFATTRSPGGYLLASASPEEVALAPDGERHTAFTGELIRLLRDGDPAGHTNFVNAVVFSPDGHTLASSSNDHTARLWNVPSALMTGHISYVHAAVFSRDGHTLASGSADGTVRLWNVTDPAHPTHLGQPLTGHTNVVNAVELSPDGRTLASGSGDQTVRLWNVTDPAHPTSLGQPLTGHTDTVDSVVFSPNGHTLASGSHDRTVRLWGMNGDQAIQRICATTRNILTPAKWEQYVSNDLPYRPPCP